METIFIVEDNSDMRRILSNLMQEEGYQAVDIKNGLEAIREIKRKMPDLILLDLNLPGKGGMEVLQEVKDMDPDMAVIIVTAYGDIKGAVQAMKMGAFDYITKPFDNDELLLTIKRALHTRSLYREVKILRRKLGERIPQTIIGRSPQLQEALKQVHLVAPTNLVVILQGESGTGKEMIAQLIHAESPRREKPFVAMDCGAIPETLIESHLFGHEKGAFTGALEKKEGIFEQAQYGTLFLDEITNLTQAAQMKFLRVLEEKKLQHLGGQKTYDINVRIIVSANIDLEKAVAGGVFREDLFHRVNEFRISLPPLRERKGDSPLLARFFLDEFNQEFERKIQGFSPEAEQILNTYEWPGNVRELRNVIRRAVLLCESPMIGAEHLCLGAGLTQETRQEEQGKDQGSLEEILDNVEADVLKKALEKAGGNKSEAARLLNMNRKTFYRRWKKRGLCS